MSTFLGQARARMPRLLESAQERARLTVVPQRATQVARVPFAILVLLLLGAGLVGLLVLNTSLQQGAFRAAALQSRQVALGTRQHDLELEISALQNPQRLARVAQHLGMVPNTNPVFIDASTGQVLGSPVPAIPGTGPELRPPPPPPPPVRHHHRHHHRHDHGGNGHPTGPDTSPHNATGQAGTGNNGHSGTQQAHHQQSHQQHPSQRTQKPRAPQPHR